MVWNRVFFALVVVGWSKGASPLGHLAFGLHPGLFGGVVPFVHTSLRLVDSLLSGRPHVGRFDLSTV